MARFAVPAAPVVPVVGAPFSLGPTASPNPTHEGGGGFASGDARAELFNAAVSGMLADGFYEKAGDRLARVQALARAACALDPEWVRAFVPWLRTSANLRSAPLVIAAEYAALGLDESRALVAAACQRADEPGELLAYWRSYHGRAVPSRVKRGLSDACARLYTERAVARYDGQGKGWRFGDVLEVVHGKPKDARQSDLYKHLLDRRRHPTEQAPLTLPATRDLRRFMDATPVLRSQWRDGGAVLPALVSWERLAAETPGGLDAAWWSALIMGGHMGGMALLRNLNNLDRARVDDPVVVAEVRRLLSDADEIAKARLLPYRFLTAYANSETDRWRDTLDAGAGHALANLPTFRGNTIIMVDCSGSMSSAVGGGKSRSPLSLTSLAGFVAEALARRCERSLIVCYADGIRAGINVQHHVGVLRAASRPEYRPTGGTNTWRCAAEVFAQVPTADRFVILTDEQTSDTDHGDVGCPVVTWNLAGYGTHQAHHGIRNRYLVAGYSDTALQTLPDVILHGSTGRWPWQPNP